MKKKNERPRARTSPWFFGCFWKCSNIAEFCHVGFVLPEKHCSVVFFRWVALRFGEIVYAKKALFHGGGLERSRKIMTKNMWLNWLYFSTFAIWHISFYTLTHSCNVKFDEGVFVWMFVGAMEKQIWNFQAIWCILSVKICLCQYCMLKCFKVEQCCGRLVHWNILFHESRIFPTSA